MKNLTLCLASCSLVFSVISPYGSLAEDIGVVPSGSRTAPVRRSVQPTRTVPQPIQDGTTRNSVAPARVAAPRPAAARPAVRRSQEQAVDLDALTDTAPSKSAVNEATSTSVRSAGGMSPHKSSGVLPNFKFYFDFLLRSYKGQETATSGGFSFDSYHQRMLVEYTPTPDLMFHADISAWSTPEYFEVDYMLSERVQLRWGKIWIPFDDMSPHSMFGGRMNTREFFQGTESAFLPNIWAEPGIGFKFILADSASFSSQFHAYVTNGFPAGGTSPVSGEGGVVEYPNFEGTTRVADDNNNAKALGGRLHMKMGQRFGIGISYYTSAYTNQGAVESKSVNAMGGDIQLRPTNTTDIRAGLVTMKVGLNGASKPDFTRGGTYIELGQKFGTENRWKFLVRAGKAQNDSRVIDVSDKTLVGATILRNFGSVEAQINYYRDTNKVALKTAYDYGALRLVTAF